MKLFNAIQGIKRFARIERILAFVCLFIPAFLIWFDNGPIRDSISAYYDMDENQIYYFPLTMASMLFIFNGVIKHKKHYYNTYLGVMLAGVILFNYHDFSILHNIFAIAFFAGNAVVVVVFTSKKERWFKVILVVGILSSMVGFFFGWITLFLAEWLSFGIIAFHYILESWGIID